MVSTSTTRDATRLTICNYNKYAFDRNTSETQTETQIDTAAEHSRNKDKEGKKVIKEEGVGGAASEASIVLPSKANAASKPGRTKKHHTQWPEGFALNDDMRAYANERGWTTPTRQNAEFEKYHQHALQTGRLLKDWVAGWRSWVLKGTEFDRPRIAALTVSAVEPPPVDWNSRVAKFKTNGLWPLPWGPQPGCAGCRAPPDDLARNGYPQSGIPRERDRGDAPQFRSKTG
jgi:hypothetical protein